MEATDHTTSTKLWNIEALTMVGRSHIELQAQPSNTSSSSIRKITVFVFRRMREVRVAVFPKNEDAFVNTYCQHGLVHTELFNADGSSTDSVENSLTPLLTVDSNIFECIDQIRAVLTENFNVKKLKKI